MPYENINGNISCEKSDVHIVDLRSDTISKPTKEMRHAMANAEVGDDVFGEDPTVTLLEKKSAELLGKEEGLFVPSGTMANLISIMVHCSQRGSEVIAGDRSHTFLFEQAGAAQIAGVQMVIIKNEEDGSYCLEEVKSKIRIDPDQHEPFTSLILVENTHNMCGGKVLPLSWLDELSKIAKAHGIPIHMDGARVFNAAVQSKLPAKRLVRDVDSVCFCLSKNLGCPMGSVLCGSKNFIARARRTRKVLGGGLRQAGIVAAAGLVALDSMIDRLAEDHGRIFKIAKAIDDMNSDVFKVDLKSLHTNILMVYIDKSKVVAKEFLTRLATVRETDPVKISLKGGSRDLGCVRFVAYWETTDEDVNAAIAKLQLVINEYKNK